MYVRTMRKDRMNMIQGDVSWFIYIMKDALKIYFIHMFLRFLNRIVVYIVYPIKNMAAFTNRR